MKVCNSANNTGISSFEDQFHMKYTVIFTVIVESILNTEDIVIKV